MKLFKDFLKGNEKNNEPNRVVVELTEATYSRVGQYEARRDKPHFQGDEYHGTVSLGGKEASWTVSGKRRHPDKFPAHVPNDAKLAVAKVLRIDPANLEAYEIIDESTKERILLLEEKG